MPLGKRFWKITLDRGSVRHVVMLWRRSFFTTSRWLSKFSWLTASRR
jgi:hypothetical protein